MTDGKLLADLRFLTSGAEEEAHRLLVDAEQRFAAALEEIAKFLPPDRACDLTNALATADGDYAQAHLQCVVASLCRLVPWQRELFEWVGESYLEVSGGTDLPKRAMPAKEVP